MFFQVLYFLLQKANNWGLYEYYIEVCRNYFLIVDCIILDPFRLCKRTKYELAWILFLV